MAGIYPEGVSLCTLTLGKAASWGGQIARIEAKLSSTHNVVHAASGWSFSAADDAYTSGVNDELQIVVPHTDQAGFVDDTGAAFTGWAYIITGSFVFAASNKRRTFTVKVQPLVGQTVIDLDTLPAGNISGPVVGPQASVQSLAGLTGTITLGELVDVLDGEIAGGIPPEEKGAPAGVATLDGNARLPETQVPSRLSPTGVVDTASAAASNVQPSTALPLRATYNRLAQMEKGTVTQLRWCVTGTSVAAMKYNEYFADLSRLAGGLAGAVNTPGGLNPGSRGPRRASAHTHPSGSRPPRLVPTTPSSPGPLSPSRPGRRTSTASAAAR